MIVVYTRQPTDDQDAHDTHTHETTDDDREWSGGSRRRRKKKRRRRRNVDEGHQQQKGTGSGAHQITALSLTRSLLLKWRRWCWRSGGGSRWSVVKLFGSECAAVGLSEWVEESEQWQEWWGRQSEWAAAAERKRRTIISNSFKYTTRSKPTEEEGRREENVD